LRQTATSQSVSETKGFETENKTSESMPTISGEKTGNFLTQIYQM
jgi:hypothetical protein